MFANRRSVFVLATVFAALGVAIAGCGGKSKTKTSTTAAVKPASFTTALVLSVGESSANPYGFSNLQAFQAVEKQLGVKGTAVELVPTAQFTSTLTNFARQGVGLIYAGGEEFQMPVYQVAPKFPKSTFICVTCGPAPGQPKNVINLRPNFTQVNYLGGVAAGLATRTNKIGDIGGIQLPDLVESADGFKAGVRAVNPKASVDIVYVGTFQDPSKVRAAAQAMLGRGIDVIRHEGNAAGAGLFDAVKGTTAWAVGSYRDQKSLAPSNTLTSTGPNWTGGYVEVAKLYRAHKLTKSTYELDFSNGGVFVAPINPKAPNAAAIQKRVNQDKQKIISGQIKLPDKDLG